MKLFFIFYLMFNYLCFTQNIKIIKKGDFPAGVYMTLSDVLNKIPSSNEELYYKSLQNSDSLKLPEKVFFYYKIKNKKVKFPLAVSFEGEMYFQTYRKYTNKKDGGYDPDQYSRFCKVSSYGRFIYFEEDMKGFFSKIAIGSLLPSTYLMSGKTKGIVLDLNQKEFNIFRNCKDINEFLKANNLKQIDCNSENYTISDLRKLIEKINTE